MGAVRLSFHPAGHVLGSAQVRIESGGRVWVVTGDYKLAPDSTCRAFEPVRCEVLITESTFGLPVYRWDPPERVFADILDWWQEAAAERRPCVLFAYSLGKAQRLIAGLSEIGGGGLPGALAIHPAIEPLNRAYRASGIGIAECEQWAPASGSRLEPGTLLIAPPALAGSAALGRGGEPRLGIASGWMQVRGARRRRGVDRGFVLSDHADWPALNQAIAASGATRVIVTHGYEAVMVRHLSEAGIDAGSFTTEYGDERTDDRADDPAHAVPGP
jgi:putative mRNA 3-end processing factor